VVNREYDPLMERLIPEAAAWPLSPGLSYLIRTGTMRLLFHSGLSGGMPQSTLGRNAAMLGAGPCDLDAVVISRLHADHVGGLGTMRRRPFAEPLEPRVPAYVPTPMRHPCARCRGHHRPARDRAWPGRAAADAVLDRVRYRTGPGGQSPQHAERSQHPGDSQVAGWEQPCVRSAEPEAVLNQA
jgi:glyoxylase-like metal-dependent hydrolase (beta-lactamase superfamily II)